VDKQEKRQKMKKTYSKIIEKQKTVREVCTVSRGGRERESKLSERVCENVGERVRE